MAARITGRPVAVVPESMGAERRSIVEGYCAPWVELVTIRFEPDSGLLDLEQLQGALSDEVACVYFEVPGFLGTIESQAEEIAARTHEAGALCVVEEAAAALFAPGPGLAVIDQREYGETVIRFIERA